MAPATIQQPMYIRSGIILDSECMTVDLAEPRTLLVRGVNSRTGEEKTYLLKVTQAGKLLLI
jgi:hypothetical protein